MITAARVKNRESGRFVVLLVLGDINRLKEVLKPFPSLDLENTEEIKLSEVRGMKDYSEGMRWLVDYGEDSNPFFAVYGLGEIETPSAVQSH